MMVSAFVTIVTLMAVSLTGPLAIPVGCEGCANTIANTEPVKANPVPKNSGISNTVNPKQDPWLIPAPVWSKGNARYYASGVMEATASVRGMSLKGYLDGVALMSPSDIGTTVWMKAPGFDWEGPFLVVDCAAKKDLLTLILTKREVVEVGWTTARRWKMLGPISDVEVSKVPPFELEGRPLDYPSWWAQQAGY